MDGLDYILWSRGIQPKKYCIDCLRKIDEECGIDGREIYDDTEACGSYEQKNI